MSEKFALISVANKNNLKLLAEKIVDQGYQLISTSGTAKYLKDEGFQVIEVSDLTNFPEILDGRVKTLHPKVFAGVLAESKPEHQEVLEAHNIKNIELLVVNLYPFGQVIESDDVTFEKAINNIDIGGAALIRAAAKNHAKVTVLASTADYEGFISRLEAGQLDENYRLNQAAKAFKLTSDYDQAIAAYLTGSKAQPTESKMPARVNLRLELKQELSYGENPHQGAALYVNPQEPYHGLANARQLHGKQLSFNNYNDLDAAYNICQEYNEEVPCAVIIKHTNPCGVAIAPSITQAFIEAFSCDTVSAFGGIVALNNEVDLSLANELHEIFLEAIIAPAFSSEALALLTKKKNLRLITLPNRKNARPAYDIKCIEGAYLVQNNNLELMKQEEIVAVTKKQVPEDLWIDLILAWKVVKHVKSNAVVAAHSGKIIGVGAGQMNRVKAVEDALKNFDLDTRGAVLASDAFFPFADSVNLAAQNNIEAIIQPGGSIRDQEVIEACNAAEIAMVFTGIRHFKH